MNDSASSGLVALRSAVASIALAATTIVGIAGFEGYRDTAYIPIPGDVPTIGYGSTEGVKMGDKITPDRALHRLMTEVDSVYAQGVRRCVLVPLTDYEFGAYVSLAYNIGVPTFCRRARRGKPPNLIDLINDRQYAAACKRIEAFVYGPDGRGGKKIIRGLQKRRKEERRICEGKAQKDYQKITGIQLRLHERPLGVGWSSSGITTNMATAERDSGPKLELKQEREFRATLTYQDRHSAYKSAA